MLPILIKIWEHKEVASFIYLTNIVTVYLLAVFLMIISLSVLIFLKIYLCWLGWKSQEILETGILLQGKSSRKSGSLDYNY